MRVVEGDLDVSLPAAIASRVDVMVGVLPYVPTEALRFLPRDVQRFEPRVALDGGPGGMDLVVEGDPEQSPVGQARRMAVARDRR